MTQHEQDLQSMRMAFELIKMCVFVYRQNRMRQGVLRKRAL